MAFSSKSFQLFNKKKLRHFKLSEAQHRFPQVNVNESKKRAYVSFLDVVAATSS